MKIEVPITDPKNERLVHGKLTTTSDIGEWIARSLAAGLPIGFHGSWTWDDNKIPELLSVSLGVVGRPAQPRMRETSQAKAFEIGNEILRVLREYEQRKSEEMKSELNNVGSENAKAYWEKFLEGVSVSISMAQNIVEAHNTQPVEVASTGTKEGEQ